MQANLINFNIFVSICTKSFCFDFVKMIPFYQKCYYKKFYHINDLYRIKFSLLLRNPFD